MARCGEHIGRTHYADVNVDDMRSDTRRGGSKGAKTGNAPPRKEDLDALLRQARTSAVGKTAQPDHHKRHAHHRHSDDWKPARTQATDEQTETRSSRSNAATSVEKTSSSGGPGGEVKAAFDRINAHRAQHGLRPLAWSPAAASIAQEHSDRQAGQESMFHSKSYFSELSAQGAHAANENVAYGYKTGDAVFNGWKYSPGHNANMLSSKITSVGLAVAYSEDGTPYWTMNGAG